MSASSKPIRARTTQTVEQIEQRLQQRWFDLTQAEDAGKGADILANLFARYMADLEALTIARDPAPKRAARHVGHAHTMISA